MVQLNPAPSFGIAQSRDGENETRTRWANALRANGLSLLGQNLASGALLVFDFDLCLLATGGVELETLGLADRAVPGVRLADVFGVTNAAVLEPVTRRALYGRKGQAEIAWQDRVLLCHVSPVMDDASCVLGGMLVVSDVTQARSQEKALREAVEQFQLAFDNAPIGEAVVELDGTFRQVNTALCELTGYPEEELLQRRFQDITHPDDRASDVEFLQAVLRGERRNYQLEKRYMRPDGSVVWAYLSVVLLRSSDGTPLHFISQIQDVSERKRRELESVEAHTFQQAVFAASPDTIYVYDLMARHVLWSSRSVPDLLGVTQADLDQDDLSFDLECLSPDTRQDCREAFQRVSDGPDGDVVELRARVFRRDGRVVWTASRLTPFRRDADGKVTMVLGVSRDITNVVAVEERLEHAALHDELTGLPNRRQINQRLGEMLARTDEPASHLVLYCDLDGFKRVNDAHGHHIGDTLLRQSAHRLVDAARAGDLVGRMGGDEFVVLVPIATGEDPTAVGAQVAQRIIEAVSRPVQIAGMEHLISASVGICVAEPGTPPEDLLRDADTAMYRAKLNGKAGFVVFDPSMREDAYVRDGLVRQIRQSLADDTVEVHYQPAVNPVTGRVVAVEALLRIPTGDGKFLDAASVISVAEQSGLMGAIGERVLRRSCEQVAAWRATPGRSNLRLAVNMSATEISRAGFYDRICRIVRSTGFDMCALILEITETVLLDADAGTIEDLRRLNAAGVSIAIDDFGMGYAGLRYLATLPVSTIKIDRSFISRLPGDATCATIVRSTARLAADLRIACVIEGVETTAQLEALPTGDMVFVQGYLFGRPRPPDNPPPVTIQPQLAVT